MSMPEIVFEREKITELKKDHQLEEIIAMEHRNEPEEFRRLCSSGVAVITGLADDVLKKMKSEADLSSYIEDQLIFLESNGDIKASKKDIEEAAVAAGWFLARTGGFIPDVFYIELDMAEYKSREDAIEEMFGRGMMYPGDACVGKYETESEAREALAKMPSEIKVNKFKRHYKFERTNYSLFRTVEDASEPSWDVCLASSELESKKKIKEKRKSI